MKVRLDQDILLPSQFDQLDPVEIPHTDPVFGVGQFDVFWHRGQFLSLAQHLPPFGFDAAPARETAVLGSRGCSAGFFP